MARESAARDDRQGGHFRRLAHAGGDVAGHAGGGWQRCRNGRRRWTKPAADDGRWTIDDGVWNRYPYPIVHRPSSIVRKHAFRERKESKCWRNFRDRLSGVKTP